MDVEGLIGILHHYVIIENLNVENRNHFVAIYVVRNFHEDIHYEDINCMFAHLDYNNIILYGNFE